MLEIGAASLMFGLPPATLEEVGQTLLALDGTIEFFRDSVFNYPSFAEAYKVAALNGLNKL